MSPRKYKAKVDANQAEIVAALRKVGATVECLSAVGRGVPDLLVGRNGRNYLVEVKDGNKPPSAQKLTQDQVSWHACWGGQVAVVNSVEQAIALVVRKCETCHKALFCVDECKEVGGMKNESNQSDQRVFPDRGREGLFLRTFGKRNIR